MTDAGRDEAMAGDGRRGRGRTRAAAVALAAAVAALAGGAGTATADTMVYVKGGYVYVAGADGSGARPVTPQSSSWAWPSETDGGIIAAAGSPSRLVAPNFNPSGGDQIYEFDQQGRQVAGPVNTEGSYSTVGDPTYASHFRVAPDNSYVAWTVTDTLISDPYTAWRKPDGSDSFHTANDSGGSVLPYSSPEWWGPAHLLITHDGVTFGNAEYALYGVADGSSPGWVNDDAIGSSGSYQVVFSRAGTKSAVLTDDSADHSDGSIQNVAITLETSSGNLPGTAWSDTHCTITLPAAEYQTSSGTHRASMSFSSDGDTLAWAQDDGIYEANVTNPTNCASVTGSVHEVVPGGAMPFLSPAALSALQSTPPPTPKPSPTPVPTPVPCGGAAPGCHAPVPSAAPNTRIANLTVKPRARTVVVRFSGSGSGRLRFQCKLDRGAWKACRSPLTIRHLRRGRHTLSIRAVTAAGRTDRTPAVRRFRVGR